MSENIREKQYCTNCQKEVNYSPRYRNYICKDCATLITDVNGRKVKFYNESFSGGCIGYYYDNAKQQEPYDSNICYINGNVFYAQEARFGGIVIQKQV